MKRRLKWLVLVLVLLVLGGLVARSLMARKAEQAKLAAPPRAGLAIELALGDVVIAARTDITRTLDISGGLKAVETAVVKARVAAEVTSLTVREGDRVKAGQLLGRLDATEFSWRLRQAEDQSQSARSQLEIAQRTLDNNRALVDQGFISKSALDTSVFGANGAQALLQSAQASAELARKSLKDTEIRAPLSGVVSQRLVQPGERVPIDAKLLEIVDLSRIELEAAVAPEDVGAVKVGSAARLQVDGLAEPAKARVVRINPSTQSGTRAVMTYLAVEPQPGLRQGLFARGAIELERKTAIVAPASAVRTDQARPYVLAIIDGKAVQRAVTLGTRGEASFGAGLEAAVEVTAGLAAGDKLLRGTVGALRDGTPVRVGAAGAPPAMAAASAASAAP